MAFWLTLTCLISIVNPGLGLLIIACCAWYALDV